jgi:hypothetical protein
MRLVKLLKEGCAKDVLLQLVTLLWNLSLTPSAARALVVSGAHNALSQATLTGIEIKRAAAGAGEWRVCVYKVPLTRISCDAGAAQVYGQARAAGGCGRWQMSKRCRRHWQDMWPVGDTGRMCGLLAIRGQDAPVGRRTSHDISHTSHVTRHTPHVTRHMSLMERLDVYARRGHERADEPEANKGRGA